MRNINLLFIGALLLCGGVFAGIATLSPKEHFVTSDIDRFWQAVDSLHSAKTKEDSIQIIKSLYIDRMSSEGKTFLMIRGYTAPEYIKALQKYPRYYRALRAKTDNIAQYRTMLDSTFALFGRKIPGYKIPRICFAIGCFRGGGTTRKDLILMGAEIALCDSLTDVSEFKGNLHNALDKGVDLQELVAHESIHCQQHHARNRSLLSVTLQEGAANFLSAMVLERDLIKEISPYERENECRLWHEFEPAAKSDDLSQWLFNTGSVKNRPPDLGYFIGMRICEAYYNRTADKQEAIKNLLDRREYLKVMEQSGYNGNCAKAAK